MSLRSLQLTAEQIAALPSYPREQVLHPFPNEHSCRLEDPSKYEEFRRHNCAQEVDDKCLDFIFGIFTRDGERTSELQAIRYRLEEGWREEAARSHCQDHDGQFEPATGDADTTQEPQAEKIQEQHECPEGQEYDPATGDCVPIAATLNTSSVTGSKTMTAGSTATGATLTITQPAGGAKPLKLYAFRWLPFQVTDEEAQALRLVKGVAIYVGKSVRQPVHDLASEDNLLKGGRSLRGALIDIDHAAVLPLDPEVYKAKYGIETLFPVGQVWDAEFEEGKVEFVASIWDPAVYHLIRQGTGVKDVRLSVVEEYRSEKLVCETPEECAFVTEGSTFPLLALTLEAEPAFPDTWVKPFEVAADDRLVATQALAPEQLAERLKQPRYVQVPIPQAATAKRYTVDERCCGQGLQVQLHTVRLHGAVAPHNPAKAPEERDWDADAAEARIRGWAGGPEEDKIDWAKYRQGFAWYNSEDPENLGSYKLPHHDIIDGRLHTVWRGVAAAMQVLLGGRGGVDLPASDREAVYRHLRAHYEQFEKEPPEFHRSLDSVWTKVTDLAQTVEALKAEVREVREEKERVEQVLATLKGDRTQGPLGPPAPPTGLVEAHPTHRQGERCDHSPLLAALPEERDTPKKLPTDIFRGWVAAVERNTQSCPHGALIKPYTLNSAFIPVKFVSHESLLHWLRNVRRVLSQALP